MEINYRTMIKSAKDAGLATDKTMWTSIDNLSEMLDTMKSEHSELYWKFMRKQHGILYGNHYGPEFAEYDVSQIKYTDSEGMIHTGAHWTKDEIASITSGFKFPQGTTICDKYVAFNAAYADFSKEFTDDQILKIGYLFFFADEDWGTNTKVWEYFCCRNK